MKIGEMNMSKEEWVQRQEQIIEEVSFMTVNEFQTECENFHIQSGIHLLS